MKNKRKPEDSSIFFELLENTPQESKNYVSKSLEIVHQIALLLEDQGINQKGLAAKLNKTEAEISKWLSGAHNFTIRTLTAIGTALGEEIIVTPYKVQNNFLHYMKNKFRASVNEKDAKPKGEKSNFSVDKLKAGENEYQIAA
jgi:transcriptional regulator with XRE-family HTH domain